MFGLAPCLTYFHLHLTGGGEGHIARILPRFLAARLRKLGRGLMLFAYGILIEGVVSCGSICN